MCKKICLMAMVIVFLNLSLIAVQSRAEYFCGDASGDSMVNVSDAVFIIGYVFSGGPPPDEHNRRAAL